MAHEYNHEAKGLSDGVDGEGIDLTETPDMSENIARFSLSRSPDRPDLATLHVELDADLARWFLRQKGGGQDSVVAALQQFRNARGD